jgi:ribosomal-protein-alanine N-acetyltransferase
MKARKPSARLITIVPARTDEAATLAEIHAACFPEPWTEADFEAFLRQPGIAGWITGGKHADGFILVRRAAEEAEILTLAVRPEQRRRGFARLLVEHAMEELRARGTASCFLEVAVDNKPARDLYVGAGFIVCARRPDYYARQDGARADAVVMRRDL